MSQNTNLQDSIKQIYFSEFDEQVETLESGLIKLEKNATDESVIRELFRCSHNIKGSSAAVGFTEIAALAHVAETLMSSIKNHFVKVNDEIMMVLFRFVDALKEVSSRIKQDIHDFTAITQETRFIEEFTAQLLGSNVSQSASPRQTGPSEIGPAIEPPSKDQVSSKLNQDPNTPAQLIAPEQPKDDGQDQKERNSGGAVQAVDAKLKETTPKETQVEEFIKIAAGKVDRLIELFGEQVILLSTIDHAFENIESDGDRAKRSITELRKITHSLHRGVVTLRMVTVSPLVKRLERSVRDAGKITGKDIRFNVIGENIEIDKTILDVILNPLTHLVRNAVDHGIESAEERDRQGKPRHGSITLSFRRSGDAIDITIADDGSGLNRERILNKAIKMGLAQGDRIYTDAEVNHFIFKNGFSTNDAANELSGRGVGMDVVLKTVQDLKGSVLVDTNSGQGTKFTCRLPLSLDMFNGTIVKLDGERYVCSNSEYKETVNVDTHHIEKVGQEDSFIRLGNRVIKLIDLRRILVPVLHGKKQSDRQNSTAHASQQKRVPALVLEFQGVEFGFLVEELLAQEQIVLKRISNKLGRVSGAIGCTILGDGKVALILSLSKIIESRLGMAA